MRIITDHLHEWNQQLPAILMPIDRLTLAKRRWRGIAADGEEFGFDLEHHLHHGDVFFQSDAATYRIEQTPEQILEIHLNSDSAHAARLGWMIGNLHFQLEIVDGAIRVADDPALRQLFEREHIPFTQSENAFHPLSGGHHH